MLHLHVSAVRLICYEMSFRYSQVLIMFCVFLLCTQKASVQEKDLSLCEICETMVKEVTGLLESNKTEVNGGNGTL